MSYSFEYIDIILLAMIAGFIFLRLRGILGKRTGFEGKAPPKFEEVLNKMKTEKVQKINENFNYSAKKEFLKGAQIAYETIITDFSDNDNKITTSKPLLNTEIYNHSSYGILGRETNIEAHNVVIGNAGQASLAATIGGTYNFTHSTFANFWSNSLRQLPAVLINNFFTYTNTAGQEVIETRNLHAANFTNCIFDGNNNIEFVLDKVNGEGIFNYKISNSMISFTDTNNSFKDNTELDFTSSFYQNIILNGRSHFRDTQINDFIIGKESDAINKAKATSFSLDILETDRSTNPDIGAYQHIIFE